jgi:hypothetical protein
MAVPGTRLGDCCPAQLIEQLNIVSTRAQERGFDVLPVEFVTESVALTIGGDTYVLTIDRSAAGTQARWVPSREGQVTECEVRIDSMETLQRFAEDPALGARFFAQRKMCLRGPLRKMQQLRKALEVVSAEDYRSLTSGLSLLSPDLTTVGQQSLVWRDDRGVRACAGCKARFTLIRRKHHCRWCGNVFCNSCSPLLPSGTQRVRRCAGCVDRVGPPAFKHRMSFRRGVSCESDFTGSIDVSQVATEEFVRLQSQFRKEQHARLQSFLVMTHALFGLLTVLVVASPGALLLLSVSAWGSCLLSWTLLVHCMLVAAVAAYLYIVRGSLLRRQVHVFWVASVVFACFYMTRWMCRDLDPDSEERAAMWEETHRYVAFFL